MSIPRTPSAVAILLAAFVAGCQSAPQSLHAAGAPLPLSPAATALEAQTKAVANHCVAVTVGILSAHGAGFASGSGVLVSADGLILTAGHVVDKPGTPLILRLPNGRVVKGVALGVDRGMDSGMARITDPAPAGGWPFARIAPADSAKPGDWVLATGNPGGVVVGRNPPLRLGRVTIHDKERIQSDCTVVSGDSGGPLFDLSGRVVGIHSNISLSVDENRHVPVSIYRAQWQDLLAGKTLQSGGGMLDHDHANGRRHHRPGQVDADLSRIGEALGKLVKEGDAEAKKLMDDAAANGGNMTMDPVKGAELIARAKLPPKDGAKAGAPSIADISRIGEALKKLVKEGDAEAKKLMADAAANGGKMKLDAAKAGALVARAKLPPAPKQGREKSGIPADMRPMIRAQVKSSLEKQFPGANVTDAVLEQIMDKSTFDAATGHLALSPDVEDLKAMGVSPEAMASPQTTRVSQRLGERSLQALALFAPALDAVGDCIVDVCSDGKPILMGTVVGADGWIVTKASDLGGKLSVVLADGQTLEAKLAGSDEATDLALLKVEAKGLEAAPFAVDHSPLGAWLVSPVRDPNRPAVGLVSVAARPIPAKFTHFQGEQKIMIGLTPAGNPGSMEIGEVVAGLPAATAGVKSGDKILALDGQPVSDWMKFVAKVKEGKPGQVMVLKARRDSQEMEFKMTLGGGKSKSVTNDSIGETDKVAGGKLSKRRSGFPSAIQHDAVVWADQCGGPLVDLRGKVVGVNIARYDRVCTFAIPASLVRQTVARLRMAALAKPADAGGSRPKR